MTTAALPPPLLGSLPFILMGPIPIPGILTLNPGAMLVARWFMAHAGAAPLLVLGAVFSVLQAAMGVEMLMSGLPLSRLVA